MSTQATRGCACSQGELLPRRYRIRERRDFERSRREGRRAVGVGFAVEVTRTNGPTRLGLAVSRRVGGAVVRNRVKRRVREWFRRGRGAVGEGIDLVVIARSRAAAYTGLQTSAELGALVAKVRR